MSEFAGIESVVRDLVNLDPEMWAEVASQFGCVEAIVIADLLEAVGVREHAVALLTAHDVELVEHNVSHDADKRVQQEIYTG